MVKKILVPVDWSAPSLRGVEFAFSIAKPLNSNVIAIHVIPNLFSYGIPRSNLLQKKSRIIAEKNLKKIQRMAENNGIKFSKKIQVDSNIGKSIVEFSEKNSCDMIIIGSKGPDPRLEMFLGSVANYVINKAKKPVLIVK